MTVYENQFSPDLDMAAPVAVRRTLLIASTPRSGSHMLGHSLAATGAMGQPFEYCNPRNLQVWQRRLGTRGVHDTLAELMKLRTSANGVFAIKLHYAHLSVIGGLEAALEMLPNPAVVMIYRGDLLRQAISFSEAVQTDVWISGMPGNGKTAEYDPKAIRVYLEMLALHNSLWRVELERLGLDWLEVEFENFRRNVAGEVARVAEFAGIEVPLSALPTQPPTRRQSSGEAAAAMVHRFAEDRAQEDRRRGRQRRVRGWLSKLRV